MEATRRYELTGEYRPFRRNNLGVKCGICSRVFAAGTVPAPLHNAGEHTGKLVCADCRAQLEARKVAPHPQLF